MTSHAIETPPADAEPGKDRIDGGALLEYVAPLKAWPDHQNAAFEARQK